MRISDWSSDVCSSDLCDDDLLVRHRRHVTRREDTGLARRAARVDLDLAAIAQCHRIAEPFGVWDQADLDENPFEFDEMFLVPVAVAIAQADDLLAIAEHFGRQRRGDDGDVRQAAQFRLQHRVGAQLRSEEHTSELQSLMRISYAVFCLKKKKICD